MGGVVNPAGAAVPEMNLLSLASSPADGRLVGRGADVGAVGGADASSTMGMISVGAPPGRGSRP
ncbi:hypothetical protein TL11_21010 [Mycobacteroides immunogenum]|nr:hypothetical protein TL11_21010 [Mycobacteroides immunogenum]